MVFSGLYPADGSDFDALNHAIERLTCNDASVSVMKETSTALGMGFRYFSHAFNMPFSFFFFFFFFAVLPHIDFAYECHISSSHGQVWFPGSASHGCLSSTA